MNFRLLLAIPVLGFLILTGILGCESSVAFNPLHNGSNGSADTGEDTDAPVGPLNPHLPSTTGRSGDIDGVRLWTLPNGPNNSLIPDQNWHSIGSDPAGDIYVSGMDHIVNSGLYRLYVGEGQDRLGYVGDAKTASQAVNNWKNETAEKFHNRPVYYDGKMYVATTDKTDVGGDYRRTRGFHWYSYDIVTGDFIDMSADQPGGVGYPELQILTLAVDPENGYIYGMANAVLDIVRLDVDSGVTENLGKPRDFGSRYVYGNRFMWVDSRGVLYFSAGTTDRQWNQGENAAVFNSLYAYDPATDSFSRSFSLNAAHAIEVGQWTRDRKHLYAMDDRGYLYRFDDDGPSFSHLGEIIPANMRGSVWSLQLSPDEKKIYVFWGVKEKNLYEYDIESGRVTELATAAQLSGEVANQYFITGYDSWDNNGSFYTGAFTMYGGGNVILMQIDPARVKAARGISDGLIEASVSYDSTQETIRVHRSSSSSNREYEALVSIYGYSNGERVESIYADYAISNGADSVTIPLSDVRGELRNPAAVDEIHFTLLADGNEYVTTGNTNIQIAF